MSNWQIAYNRSKAAKKAAATKNARLAGIYWGRSEWADEPAASADVNGITADVWWDEERSKYLWSVRPTSSRCEWPEVIAVGQNRTMAAAKRAAGLKALKADAKYPTIAYD